MKFAELKKGDVVFDRWWPVDVHGPIIAKGKARLIVQTRHEQVTYDKAHCQFLETDT